MVQGLQKRKGYRQTCYLEIVRRGPRRPSRPIAFPGASTPPVLTAAYRHIIHAVAAFFGAVLGAGLTAHRTYPNLRCSCILEKSCSFTTKGHLEDCVDGYGLCTAQGAYHKNEH